MFAIVLVPLLLAGAFGGLRVYSGWNEAADSKVAADRAEMVPAIERYTAALESALLANSTGGDTASAIADYDAAKQELQRRLGTTDVVPDVARGVDSLLDDGQSLLDQVTANSVALRDRITGYAPILLTAEDAVNGSVRVDDESIRADAMGLSRAMGARGQMVMQQLLVNLGAQVPEPELRTSMITLAGTEPSTLFGMVQVLGVGSPDAEKLQAEMVRRMALMSDPAVPLVNNPEISESIRTTEGIARQVIDRTTADLSSGVEDQAAATRSEAIRDSVIVGIALLLALILVAIVSTTLIRPLRRLRDGALRVAHEDLARELDRVRSGGEVHQIQPLPVYTTEEIGQVAHAVDELHEQAVLLAGEQSRLQVQLGDMFETLSRRSRSLVDQQLSLIDHLERDEEDPERLRSLFRLDHLAARMRRNGANLLVLAGSKVPREHADPVPVAALIDAAASEVEDYTRVVTATVPDSEVLGVVAGDLVHLLAELLDNALRYSPPVSQVRVSAVHTGNGGLVVEISDAGLGMTDADLRVANARLQSGGEVNPYTARHMGLFVVGRLAAQHGLVVRLRNTTAGERNSGTTAGVYVPAELLLRNGAPIPADTQAPAESAAAESQVGSDEFAQVGSTEFAQVGYDEFAEYTEDAPDTDEFVIQEPAEEPAAEPVAEPVVEPAARNGHVDVPVSFLPQRKPGASGIADIPPGPPEFTELTPSDVQAPTDTSAFFASRAHAAAEAEPEPEPLPRSAPAQPRAEGSGDGSIFDKMLSEWLIDDPHELAQSTDLDWQTVWDKGWSAAAAAEEAPVAEHTDDGLPVRQPGARLVPGAADDDHDDRNGVGANGRNGAQNGTVDESRPMPARDPEAVRASMSSHFGGVHAGRNHVRESRETDRE
ncbi:ATP-binding protein [Mycolicibacterium sp. GCM10028919]|uniref:HAMP domain-containing sensor histidine kinase n=1 Tax=Mycolicibacterium sp. GCM10028919 TaxID=3273401 RepID=UPI00360E1CC7